MTRHLVASLSIDLDNKWSYLKGHGDRGWESLPSYLPLVVPRVIDLIESLQLPLTVFVVGLDAEQAENQSALRALADAHFEIANHSFHHEPWLHLKSLDEIHVELERTERALRESTGSRVVGFRGPGFSSSPLVREVLVERGYRYDASAFPTFLGPLARAYFMLTARLDRAEKQKRKALFGSWKAGFQSLKPYVWQTSLGGLLEIPVTTMPLLRSPIHVSYLMYLARWSTGLALSYFKTALKLCRLRGVQPSLLLHPLDFLGVDDEVGLEFFPAMDVPLARKQKVLEVALTALRDQFRVLTMRDHAELAAARLGLATRAAATVPSRSMTHSTTGNDNGHHDQAAQVKISTGS